MKKENILIWLLTIIFFSCGSTQTKNVTSSEEIQQNQPVQQIRKAQALYYEGDGGKGMSLAVAAPESEGIETTYDYLPTLIQGVLVNDIRKFSAISVLDRVNFDRLINETLDPIYEDENDSIKLAHVAGTDYILTGNIIKTASGYTLQFQIADRKNGMTKASYSGNCTVAEMDSYIAIKKASLELLTQMEIDLTVLARTELIKVDNQQTINAQTSLAQGIVAQKGGTIVEALSYYYNATAFDPQLQEATSRLSILSTDISSGNIGENVRNDIQRRNEWKKILDESNVFFKKHSPFQIVYNPVLTEGNVNYSKETIDLQFSIELRPDNGFMIIQNILDGLKTTGKKEDWGFGDWPATRNDLADYMGIRNAGYQSPIIFEDEAIGHPTSNAVFTGSGIDFIIKAVLLNESGKVIGNSEIKLIGHFGFPAYGTWGRYGYEAFSGHGQYEYDMYKIVAIKSSIVAVFSNISANDISDILTIKISSVNSISTEDTGETGYINISTM
jgi:hypothetical protein